LGLENLKSVFTEGVGNNNSQIDGRHREGGGLANSPLPDYHRTEHSQLDIDDIPQSVNYFGPANSYFSSLENPIEGFTLGFHQGGYSFSDGNLGNSKLLDAVNVSQNGLRDAKDHTNYVQTSQGNYGILGTTPDGNSDVDLGASSWYFGNNQTRTITINAENVTSPRLGFGDLAGVDITDDRFRSELGKIYGTVSNIVMNPLGETILTSIFGRSSVDYMEANLAMTQVGYQIYNSIQNETFGINSAINLFGIIPNTQEGSIQFKVPLRYEDTVFELRNENFDSTGMVLPDTIGRFGAQDEDQIRGIAFQPFEKIDTMLLRTPPSSPPRDNINSKLIGTFQDPPNDVIFELRSPVVIDTGGIAWDKSAQAFMTDPVGSIAKMLEGDTIDKLLGLGPDPSVNKDVISADPNISGFGTSKTKPQWLKRLEAITFDSVASSIFGYFGADDAYGGLKSGYESFTGGIKSAQNFIEDKVDTFNKYSPIDIELPSIKIQNPFVFNLTGFGGQGITFQRQSPRELQHIIPKKLTGTINTGELSIESLNEVAGATGLPTVDTSNDRLYHINVPTTPYSQLGKTKYNGSGNTIDGKYYPRKMSGLHRAGGEGKGITGDPFTLEELNSGKTLDAAFPQSYKQIESSDNGYPFYFKDLRDNTYIVFRAYIDGLIENLTGDWGSEDYIGRSEPVYTYQKGTRDISFSLQLVAHTPHELDKIYQKMERLTRLCYPEYMAGVEGSSLSSKLRMKPPLTKFRLGELFGETNKELLGFIKTITYTYPDNSPWEFRKGQRVPKYITAQIGYTVIHDEVPSLSTTFYGYHLTPGG